MSPRRIPHYINITHADAAGHEAEQRQREREAERAAQEARERVEAERKERDSWATLEQVPAQYRTRGVVSYDPHPERRGRLRESFSCACGKHDHGHGADHNPFAGIEEPTWLEFVDEPDEGAREEARKLAERVNRARTQTPPAAGPSRVPGGGRTDTTRRTMRR